MTPKSVTIVLQDDTIWSAPGEAFVKITPPTKQEVHVAAGEEVDVIADKPADTGAAA